MDRRVRAQLVVAIAAMLFASLANGGVIASYSFDDGDLATGPDTFAIFANAKGRVELASDLRYSGSRSVAISDVAGDGDFPEVQGYFPQIESGAVRFRFAMLIATPNETLNIALAGPSWFSLEKDGIAFWLKTRDGWLLHVSDSIPKKLVQIQPFAWYVVDVRYRPAAGTYDLTITKEGVSEPVVDLKDVPNATSQPSAINMYSFVGDVHEDATSVRYYIDDVLLSTSDDITAPKFVAPGRRRLFVDAWRDEARNAINHRGCPPLLALADLGVRTISEFRERNARWQSACESLDVHAFDELSEHWPNAPAPRLGAIIALTRSKKWTEAEQRWMALAPLMRDDIRYGSMAALVGSYRESWDDAQAWLRAPAEAIGADADRVQQQLIAEEYYFVMLWKKEYAAASRYATRVAARLDSAWWRERAGDAELLAGDLVAARRDYESCLDAENARSAMSKLSDVAYLNGDAATERKYREQLFGKWSR